MAGRSSAELHRLILRAALDGEHTLNIARRFDLSHIHVVMVIKAGGEPAPRQVKPAGPSPKAGSIEPASKVPKRRGRPPKEKVAKVKKERAAKVKAVKTKVPRAKKERAAKVKAKVKAKVVRLSGRLAIDTVARLQNTGEACSTIARELGVSASWVGTVYDRAKAAGLKITERPPEPDAPEPVRFASDRVLAILARLQNTDRTLGSIARELSVSHQWVRLVVQDARSFGLAIAGRAPTRKARDGSREGDVGSQG